MTDDEMTKLFIMLRRPIYWDPIPPWLKLTPEKVHEFNEIQNRWNTKLTEIDQQKTHELAKVAGIAG